MWFRGFSTSRLAFAGKFGPRLDTAEAVGKFLRAPSGRVHDLVPKTVRSVNPAVVRKMLKLSGLPSEDLSPADLEKWLRCLETQIGFIDQLAPSALDLQEPDSHATVFRLIASDHLPPKPMGLSELMAEVERSKAETNDEKFENFNDTINTQIKL